MPLVTGNIAFEGALILIRLGVSENRRRVLTRLRMPVPAPLTVRAEIDTGSFATGFLRDKLDSLGIEHFTTRKVRTPSTVPGCPHEAKIYDVSVTLVSGLTQHYIPSVHVIASDDFDRDDGGVHGIVGRDILNRCVFTYCGPDQTFQLAF